MTVVAGIDIGTNTVRLLIADVEPGPVFRELHAEQQITRLGEGHGRSLQPQAIGRTLTVLKAFRRRIHETGAQAITAVATSAVREAENQAEFLRRAKAEAGLDVEVLSGEEEARRTHRGVVFGVGGDQMLLMDIGGGSTEFVKAEAGEVVMVMSTDIGTVRLTETYLKSDPPRPAELHALRDEIETRLRGVAERIGPAAGFRFVGTAGTVTTLAALAQGLRRYDPMAVHGMLLTRWMVARLWEELSAQSIAGRLASNPALERGRADVIVAGAGVVLAAMIRFGFEHLLVSEYGLREGIILAYLDRLSRSTSRFTKASSPARDRTRPSRRARSNRDKSIR